MSTALIALLTAISGWLAWRRNPSFSWRWTLRYVVSLGAVIAGLVLAVIAADRYSQHLSPNGQLAVLFGIVGMGSLAMIAVAIGVSLPKAATRTSAGRKVHVFRNRTHAWLKRLGWALLAFLVLELTLRGSARAVVGSVGGLFAFIGIVMVFTAYLTARRTDEWLSAVEADPWVHWTYSAQQWSQWIVLEAQRARPDPPTAFHWRHDWRKVVIPCAGMLVVPFFFWDVHVPWPVWVGSFALIAATLWIGVASSRRAARNAPAAWSKKLGRAEPQVYFGADGLFAEGDFTPWLSPGVYLEAAFVEHGPPRNLTLRFRKIMGGYGSTQSLATNVRLPLPEGPGVAADLARLQQELSAKCRQASVTLA